MNQTGKRERVKSEKEKGRKRRSKRLERKRVITPLVQRERRERSSHQETSSPLREKRGRGRRNSFWFSSNEATAKGRKTTW